jgi:hypothetical protein
MDLATRTPPGTKVGRPADNFGTAAYLDVGTAASKVVQLDGAAKLPAVDGSQLTNLPTSSKYAQYRVTDSTDVTVSTACSAGGVNVGSGQSITLAAGDMLRVTLVQADYTSTVNNGARLGILLDVAGTVYAVLANSRYAPIATANNNTVISGGNDMVTYALDTGGKFEVLFDVTQLGMATGAQTVQIKVGKTAAAANDDTFVLKGTTASRPTTFLLEHLKA